MSSSRPRRLLAVGWLAVDETADGLRPGGVAARAAIRAATAGHHVSLVGRVGQDSEGETLLGLMREAGVDTAAVQQDPDLGTAVRRIRGDGTADRRIDASPAAPDTLQWDFDMEDRARRADAVVFSIESWRSGQARSEERRLLEEASGAVRAADLVHRTPSGRAEDPVRDHLRSALEAATIAILDARALASLTHESLEGLGDAASRWAAATRCAGTHHAMLLVPATGDPGNADDAAWWLVDPADASDAPPRLVTRDDIEPTAVLVDAALAMVRDAAVDAIAAELRS